MANKESEALKKFDSAKDLIERSAANLTEALQVIEDAIVLTESQSFSQSQRTGWRGYEIIKSISIVTERSKKILLSITQSYMNRYYRDACAAANPEDYKLKLATVRSINDSLRSCDGAIKHPDTNEPCTILAVASRDGFGRYTLEDRKTKTRSRATKNLQDLLPFQLIPDVPRKEGFIEGRKKKEEAEENPE